MLEDETAKTPQAVNDMLGKLAPPAVANARREAADLQAMIDKEQAAKGQPTFKLEPWDWSYYSEKVRKDKYAFDENELKPYLELDNVLQNGVFYAAQPALRPELQGAQGPAGLRRRTCACSTCSTRTASSSRSSSSTRSRATPSTAARG